MASFLDVNRQHTYKAPVVSRSNPEEYARPVDEPTRLNRRDIIGNYETLCAAYGYTYVAALLQSAR